MELSFLGGATTVTGSQYLLETPGARVLVDCGFFQGSPNEVARNRLPFAYDPRSVDALLLTHAHLDHCGLIPHLVASGFRGPIFATSATIELAGLVMLDAAKLQVEFARQAHRHLHRAPNGTQPPGDAEADLRTAPPEVTVAIDEPIYTEADAMDAIARFKPVAYETELTVAPGVRARLTDAGHMLGSAIIEIVAEEKRIVFSGDLGRAGAPIVRDPTVISAADYVVVESTYGGREHEPMESAVDALAETVRAVHDAGGILLVPSFALGRTQDLVWELDRLLAAGRIPHLPLFLDSPMASKASDIYRRHPECFDDEARALLVRGEEPFDYPGAKVTNDPAESKAIRSSPRPYMIVASNGMLTGGRVLAHLRDLIDDPNATLLFVGYQGEGTLGAHLQRGVKQVVIDGATRDVRCRVRSIEGFSAHADEPGLVSWMASFVSGKRSGDPGFPKRAFVVHGDPEAEAALAPKISALGIDARVPTWRERVTLP